MSRILGIDPGLAQTGWGVIETGRGRYLHVAHGSIATEAGLPVGVRLAAIRDAISEVLQIHQPGRAGIESLFFFKNVTSAIPVAQARGVVLLTLHEAGLPAMELPPGEIKRSITGAGRADKRQVQEMVRLLLGLDSIPKPDHAADALAAAICCANIGEATERIHGNV
jgi:crossover junction endodeoxyribonuclease RuvC